MDRLALREAVQALPLFTSSDLARLLRLPPASARLAAHRLAAAGLARRIERGKYTVHEDPLIFASHIAAPSYLSLWSAFHIHGFTDQVPRQVDVMVPAQRSPIRFGSYRIRFHQTRHLWGYRKEPYAGFPIFLAEPEKAILDALLWRLPLDEIRQALRAGLDAAKLVAHARRIGNRAAAKRLGFLMQAAGLRTAGLERLVDANPVPLDPSLPASGRPDPRWRVIDNRRPP